MTFEKLNEEIKFDCLNQFLNSNNTGKISLSGLLAPFDLLLVNSIIKNGKKVLFVAPDEQFALKYQKDYNNLFLAESVVFPAQEISPYSELDNNYYIYKEQINIILNKPDLVFTYPKSLLEKFTDIDFFKNNLIQFNKEENFDYAKIAKKLTLLGYKRVTNVVDVGEFSLRGDILDIYSLDDNPIRIEFFADTIEDIRYFNPHTQKSFKKAQNATIYPLYKFILDDNKKNDFKKEIENIKAADGFLGEEKELFLKIKNELLEKIEETGYFEGVEYFEGIINKNLKDTLSFFKDYVVVFKESSQILSKLENIDSDYKNQYTSNIQFNLKMPLDILNHTEFSYIKKELKKYKLVGLDNFFEFSDDAFDKIIEFNLSLPPVFYSDVEKIADFIKNMLKDDFEIVICSNYTNRLKEILNENEIYSEKISYLQDISFSGSICQDEKISKNKIVFLTDKELFSKHTRDITIKKYYSNKSSKDYIDSIDDIKEGEYVVHSIHGIGIYNGLTKQELDGNVKDYLEIQFFGGDKLFMPAEQINMLCRYRGSAIKPKLSKMGGSAWESTKAKAKKEVELIAYDLLDLYAKRSAADGINFEVDTPWQAEMEDNFEYTETQDQMKAIVEVKKDMENIKPMDRLICADVGFGKTEIALRAIFKAIMSGYQAAFIAPTTILTMQHFETLKERFDPFQVKVALLNRFCSKKEQKETVEKINNGEIDIVIATHRLLSDDINFKKLGLLVIDEEHKFGVRHKEKLKEFRENIDVLSLSATPIPRTLNMALSGIKDLSVINTPPKNRLPVKTYVGQYSETYVKNAINQEIQREGQVFYLYNRVETIENFKQKLSKIVPNARIEIAHGQMSEKVLEETMTRFAMKEFDILLCTTIIESGLDIPNANTIIIHDADRFGLAQLYQLRGRVGRSDRQAYCYCFYKKSKELNDEAVKRLNAIKDFSSLGSGYKIALRDIEIRGVGNILGERQHGQMQNVGFDTYCSLLKECIEDIEFKRNNSPYKERKEKVTPAVIDISAEAYIPDDWAPTYEQKILEYKRLSDVTTISELNDMELNFKDRFSKIPECVLNLIKLIKLRILATNANVSLVRSQGNQIRIYIPYEKAEWNLLKAKINPKITQYFSYSVQLKQNKNTKGLLLMNKSEDDFAEIFNKLADLFYYISEVVLSFKNK